MCRVHHGAVDAQLAPSLCWCPRRCRAGELGFPGLRVPGKWKTKEAKEDALPQSWNPCWALPVSTPEIPGIWESRTSEEQNVPVPILTSSAEPPEACGNSGRQPPPPNWADVVATCSPSISHALLILLWED